MLAVPPRGELEAEVMGTEGEGGPELGLGCRTGGMLANPSVPGLDSALDENGQCAQVFRAILPIPPSRGFSGSLRV